MLTPEQARFLIDNPEIRATAVDFRRRYGRAIALRYIERMMGLTGKKRYVRATLSPVQQKIVQLLEAGPRTREQLIRSGVSRESVEKYLVSLQRKGLITAMRSPQGHPPIYALARQEARA